jgi:hypothetical protein
MERDRSGISVTVDALKQPGKSSSMDPFRKCSKNVRKMACSEPPVTSTADVDRYAEVIVRKEVAIPDKIICFKFTR